MPQAQTQTEPPGGVDPLLERDPDLVRERYRELLKETRERTHWLVEPVAPQDIDRVHDPLMSPLVWDLGHIAAFEDLWLCQRAGGLHPLRPELAEVYDAAETPRPGRGGLPYLRHEEAVEYMGEVRERALEVLDSADLSEEGDELNARGLVWEMLVQHEQQHTETMLQTLKLAAPGVYSPRCRDLPEAGPCGDSDGSVSVEAGPFPLGIEDGGFAYDNERPQHEVDLPSFEIDRSPVTNGAYLEFVEAGGYARSEWWSGEGWAWKERERIERPLYWTRDGHVRTFDRTDPLDPALPVMHVSWYEADAYARAKSKRLPTEAEWEAAASWDPAAEVKRPYPWGDAAPDENRANLDQTGFGAAPAGAYPGGASAYGVLGLVGDAWEWTSSALRGYPGFRAFPYREYSEAFFGAGYRVLRGGSWATRPRAVRSTFRNWDLPERRQIHAGFRCVREGI